MDSCGSESQQKQQKLMLRFGTKCVSEQADEWHKLTRAGDSGQLPFDLTLHTHDTSQTQTIAF